MWYKNKQQAIGNKRDVCVSRQMEITELKSAISKLSARVEEIRDWL
jgi:hypothetical protein